MLPMKRSVDSIGLMLVGVCLLILGLHTIRYWPFLADDALISLRYAQRLLSGNGLTWTDGPRVEGYSNLSWVLLSAGLGRLGMDLIVAVRVLGYAASSIAIMMAAWTFMRGGERGAIAGTATAGLLLATSAPVAVWTIGGLETPLVAACLAAAWSLLWPDSTEEINPRRAFLASIPLGVLVCTRLDGPLFTAMAAAWLVFFHGKPRRSSILAAARLVTIPCVMFAAQFIFRILYYGEWIPHTARVKVSPSDRHFEEGMHYLGSFLVSAAPLALMSIAFSAMTIVGRPRWTRESRKRIVLVLVPSLAWSWYVCWIGGDIFPAFRHGMPLLVAMTFCTAEAARALFALGEGRAWGRAPLFASVIAILVVLQVEAGWRHEENRRPLTEHWEWDGQVVGTMLKKGFKRKQPLLAVDAAGTTPYFSELPCIDMLGLNDPYLPKNRPKHFGKKRIGHELGDGLYVLSRKPDLVAFGYDWRRNAYEHGAVEMQQTAEFSDKYRWCQFEGEDPYNFKFGLWIRHDSPKVGITRTDDQIVIPGYFMTGEGQIVTRLNETNQFYALVRPNSPGVVDGVPMSGGEWKMSTMPPNIAGRLRIEAASIHAQGQDVLRVFQSGEGGTSAFELPDGGHHVRLTITAESDVAIHSIMLNKDN